MRVAHKVKPVHTPRQKIDPVPDSIFFIKEQIKVGGPALLHFGRLAPRTMWDVTKIVSHRWTERGLCKPELVQQVRYLSDTVYLHCRESSETRSATFGYLSYSAIWRMSLALVS